MVYEIPELNLVGTAQNLVLGESTSLVKDPPVNECIDQFEPPDQYQDETLW